MANLKNYDVVVFDLDDTLYSEMDYVISGYRYLSELIAKLYSKDTYQTFIEALEKDEPDVFSYVLAEHKLPSLLKEHLILAYRYHSPDIKLNESVLTTLKELRLRNVPMYLITDGRGITQRLKISALRINDFFESIFISEEVGAGKPKPDSFIAIQNKHPKKSIVYIADNPKKDFIVPKQLGWGSIGVLNMHNRVHSLIGDYQDKADCWLESFKEIKI
ncbi:HAD family hydrolase [Thalassotalea sp. HSM 43]|uniref:HAD family hydrolase n=1 Tax=Thalassotalea sp. HSM 43 TaxID=2552945 RepID=UPI001080E9DA|nr:HAD family hydrolase [Thalassotalea sp. HSM 43]QBY03120.1 HAD family hydrolase [Thalassotalea sp. HSM 43]